jgi:hypothetical protein
MTDLNYYFNWQGDPLIDLTNVKKTDQENISIDFYLNKIFMENAQLDYLYTKHGYNQPIVSLSFDDYNKFSLEIAICGMQKNTRLPVPYENFSLIGGCFGDDAGFTMRKSRTNFLG